MEKTLLKIFPVQSKPYSGFWRVMNFRIPFTLIITKTDLSLKIWKIMFKNIPLKDITGFKYVGDEWVAAQKIFNGIVIKHMDGGKLNESVIGAYDKEKSLELLKLLRKLLKGKEGK